MKYQPNRNYKSDDVVQTPPALAKKLVEHFAPRGKILEPCKGEGNILKALPLATYWCEISEGRDFFKWDRKVKWVFTNPPWSQMRPFLLHSMKVSDHIMFLVTVNHFWTKARLRDIQENGFALREIVLLDTPKTFPSSGFQLGAVHLSRGPISLVKITDFRNLA